MTSLRVRIRELVAEFWRVSFIGVACRSVRSHAREIRDGVKKLWWIFVIVMPLCGFGTWLAIDHANANRDRAQARANRQFEKALIVTDRKFQQALRIQNAQTSYSINKSVCGFRGFIGPQLASYKAAAKDSTLSGSARARNDKRIRTTQEFLDTQVTIPVDFDCSTLPKNPPKGAKP